MAYTAFSTDNADYILDLGNHIHNRRNITIFEGIDALVLESGNVNPSGILLSNGSIGGNTDLVAFCKQKSVPIYFSDVRIDGEQEEQIDRKKQISNFEHVLMFVMAGYVGFSKRRSKGIVERSIQRLYAEHSYRRQLPVTAGRNAINARKIEEYIVPDVSSLAHKRKPKIGIHFGAAHMGLEYDLCSKERRDLAIFYQKNVYGKDFAPYDPETLHSVTVAQFVDGQWSIERRRIDLFSE